MNLYFGLSLFLMLTLIEAHRNCNQISDPTKLHDCKVRRWYELKDKYFQKCCQNLISIGRESLCPECDLSFPEKATTTTTTTERIYIEMERIALGTKCRRNKKNKCKKLYERTILN